MVLPIYLQGLGASALDVGIIYSILSLSVYLFELFGGFLADKYGRKMLIVLPTFALALFYFSAGASWTWLITALFIIFSDITGGLQNPAFTSMVAESVDEEHKSTAFGVYEFFINLGFVLGPLIGAALIPLYGYPILFYLTAASCGFCGVIRLTLLKETLPKRVNAEFKFTRPRLEKGFLMFTLACSIFAFTGGLIQPLTSVYAEKIHRFSIVEIELMFAVSQVAMMLVSIPQGKLVHKTGCRNCLAAAFIGACITTTVWAFCSNFIFAAAFMALSSVFLNLNYVSYNTMITQLTVPESRGAVIGTASLFMGIFAGLGSLLSGPIWDSVTPAAPFVLTGVLGIPSALILLLMRHQT